MSTHLLWQRLEQQVAESVAAFPGVAGVCVKDLSEGRELRIHADELFPTASTIKIPVLLQLLRRVEGGELDLAARHAVRPDQHVGGSGVLWQLEGALDLSLLDLAILMVVLSDNTATNLCIDLAGVEATNALLRELGLMHTYLRRKMMDHANARQEIENLSTPGELAALLELLTLGQPTPWVAERSLSILRKPKDGFLNRALPAALSIANKPGYTERVRAEVGIVELPRRPYVVAVMTKFGLADPEAQDEWVVETLRLIHAALAAIDDSNSFGHGVLVTAAESREMADGRSYRDDRG